MNGAGVRRNFLDNRFRCFEDRIIMFDRFDVAFAEDAPKSGSFPDPEMP